MTGESRSGGIRNASSLGSTGKKASVPVFVTVERTYACSRRKLSIIPQYLHRWILQIFFLNWYIFEIICLFEILLSHRYHVFDFARKLCWSFLLFYNFEFLCFLFLSIILHHNFLKFVLKYAQFLYLYDLISEFPQSECH